MTCVYLRLVGKHPDNYQFLFNVEVFDKSGVKSEDIPVYEMSSLEIAGHPFLPVKVLGMDLSHVNSQMDQPIDIIIGYNIITNANWFFDFQNNQWAIVKMLASRTDAENVVMD